MAVAYWNLILTERFKFLELWNRFLLVRAAQNLFVHFFFLVYLEFKISL